MNITIHHIHIHDFHCYAQPVENDSLYYNTIANGRSLCPLIVLQIEALTGRSMGTLVEGHKSKV